MQLLISLPSLPNWRLLEILAVKECPTFMGVHTHSVSRECKRKAKALHSFILCLHYSWGRMPESSNYKRRNHLRKKFAFISLSCEKGNWRDESNNVYKKLFNDNLTCSPFFRCLPWTGTYPRSSTVASFKWMYVSGKIPYREKKIGYTVIKTSG